MRNLGDLICTTSVITPRHYPDEPFDLYSIPAHDRGGCEILDGRGIGSPKQLVEPGDVMISKIIPHIRRVRIVGASRGRRQIASGEWIVLRSPSLDKSYLRHYLLSDLFHARFMNTVAGVGGSLVRARPAFVKEIPLPNPLPEPAAQTRIAAILDQADALRAKRREQLALLDSLPQAIFHEMFGEHGQSDTVPLSAAVRPGTIVTYGIVQAGPEVPDGVPYIRTGDINNGSVELSSLRRTAPEIAAKFQRSTVSAGDIVMSIRATVGTTAVVPSELAGANLTQGTARISPSESFRGGYLLHLLRSPNCQRWIQDQVKGATFREITLHRLRELPVPVQPLPKQVEFEAKLSAVKSSRGRLLKGADEGDRLFASLQSRAFRGEL